MLGLAAATVAAIGMSGISGILAPVLLALILTICANPVRTWLERNGVNRGVATLAVALTTFALLAAFVYALVIAVAQFSALLPDYADQIAAIGANISSWLSSIGFGPDQVAAIEQGLDPNNLVAFFSGLVGSVFGLIGMLVVLLTMLILMPADAAYAPTVLRQLEPRRPHLVSAVRDYARDVRRYMVVTTVLGLVQGAINGVALVIMGVPAAFLWALLSFLCSFIPNVGYFIAIVPPLVFGYFQGGWPIVIAIIVVYGLVNAVVQSIVQPKVVGNAVALSQTLTFFSVLFWAIILGPIGAILAVPLTLLVRMLLVDSDPGTRWWRTALGELTETKSIMKAEDDAAHEARAERRASNRERRD
ncbi:AI-2E family transporter [Agromyces mangrovi Wang et al. 2018]|uniref:AI-2E family transporter n=1 Tax=Agromyces mangrovi TaxID=1858653 RepID=UPI00257360D8|nr:AI-2E family transporter [Agromyces mangrovi]BDZ64694.1 AI-2E family transporter [Agromyces mangrovi]